jgi:hypothetical protein
MLYHFSNSASSAAQGRAWPPGAPPTIPAHIDPKGRDGSPNRPKLPARQASPLAPRLPLSILGSFAALFLAATAAAQPAIDVSASSLAGFSTNPFQPSANQTLTINATNLLGAITANASAGYEISTNGVSYNQTLTLAPNQPGNIDPPVVIASDNASNYDGGNWASGSNGGSGFGNWTISSSPGTGFAGSFIGNPASAGITNMPNPAFGLYANPGGSGATVTVSRAFSRPLLVGESFSFQWATNWDSDSGNKGFNIFAGGAEILNVNQAGFPGNITLNGQTAIDGAGYGTDPMTWTFSRTSATNLRVTSTPRTGGNSTAFSANVTISAAPDAFSFYTTAMGAGDERQPYFNNFQITSTGGNLTGTTLYARLSANRTVGAANGTIDFSYANATFSTVALEGSIVKAVPSISTLPQAKSIFETQSLADSMWRVPGTATFDGTVVSGNFSFVEPATIPAIGNSTHAIVFTPADSGNYTNAFGNVTVRVLNVPPGPPLVFDAAIGNATVGVDFTYTVGTANSPDTFAEATPLPDGLYLDPDTGTITGVPAAMASNFTTTISATNIKGTGTGNLTFTIAKGTPSISVLPEAATVYPGERVSAPQPALTGGETGPPLEGTFTYANGTQSFPSPGTYPVGIVFTPADSENWNPANGTVWVTVAPQPTYGNLTLNATPGEIEEGNEFSESLILVTLPSAIDRDETIQLSARGGNGTAIPETSPSALEADLGDGKGYVSFNQTLEIAIPAGSTEAAFYVRTANTDNFLNEPDGLSATVSANGTYHGSGNTTLAIIEDEPFGKLELLTHNSTHAVLAASVNIYQSYVFSPSSKANLASGNWTVPSEYTEETEDGQNGVPPGFERRIFTVPRVAPGGPREFFRLEAVGPVPGTVP